MQAPPEMNTKLSPREGDRQPAEGRGGEQGAAATLPRPHVPIWNSEDSENFKLEPGLADCQSRRMEWNLFGSLLALFITSMYLF